MKTLTRRAGSRKGSLHGIVFHATGRGRPYTATVFLKGCLLHCPWCNRPEALRRELRVMVDPSRCVGKETCGVTACVGRKALNKLRGQQVDRLREPSIVTDCPTNALRPDGRELTVEAVVQEVLAHPGFAARKRRQVVFSGGEPMQQFLFLKELLTAFREHGIRCVLDTAALASWRQIDILVPLVDRFDIDLKLIDYRRHRQLCGEENFPILENIRRLCHRRVGLTLILALIPGYTDTKLDLKDIGDFIKTLKPRPLLVLLPHDAGGSSAYRELGIAYPLAAQSLAAGRAAQAERYFRRRRIKVSVRQQAARPLPG